MSAAIVVAVYLLRRPLARALALGVGVVPPLTVAASRLELGVHWPTDVVAGLALGATTALVTAAGAVWVAGTAAAASSRRGRAWVAACLRSARPPAR